MGTRSRTRILAVAAAIVLAVATFAAGLAIGGRGGDGGVQVGGTPPSSPDTEARHTEAYRVTTGLAHEVSVEGLLRVARMVDPSLVSDAELAAQVAKTDDAVEALRRLPEAPTQEGVEQWRNLEVRLQNLPVDRRSSDEHQTGPDKVMQSFVQIGKDALELGLTHLPDESGARTALRMQGALRLADSELFRAREAAALLVVVAPPTTPPGSDAATTMEQADADRDESDAALGDFLRVASVSVKQFHRDAFAGQRFVDTEGSLYQTWLTQRGDGQPIDLEGAVAPAELFAAARTYFDAYHASIEAALTLMAAPADSPAGPVSTGFTSGTTAG